MLLTAISSVFSTKMKIAKDVTHIRKPLLSSCFGAILFVYAYAIAFTCHCLTGEFPYCYFSFLVFRFTLMLRWVTKHCKFTCASKGYNYDEKVDIK